MKRRWGKTPGVSGGFVPISPPAAGRLGGRGWVGFFWWWKNKLCGVSGCAGVKTAPRPLCTSPRGPRGCVGRHRVGASFLRGAVRWMRARQSKRFALVLFLLGPQHPRTVPDGRVGWLCARGACVAGEVSPRFAAGSRRCGSAAVPAGARGMWCPRAAPHKAATSLFGALLVETRKKTTLSHKPGLRAAGLQWTSAFPCWAAPAERRAEAAGAAPCLEAFLCKVGRRALAERVSRG